MIGKLKFNELIVNSLLKYAGIIKYLAYINLFLISLFIILNIIFPLNIKINYSRLVLSKDGKILTSFLSIDDKWRYESKINEISEYVRTSFLFKEDKYFYYHPGVNPVSMIRAFFDNITEGEIKSGASTITMQLARMLEPKKRSYFNKLIEIFRAFQLETFYSKDEILEMYLNKVPFGSNIEGIYAASFLYLNKYPNKLSLSQATALSVIPNAPNKLAIGFNNQLIYQEKNKWLKRMKASGVFTDQIIDAAIQEPFEAKRKDSPKYAVQLSNRLSAGNRSKSIVNSTIDYETQFNTERICYNYINSLKFFNINNCSVIIIDNKTKEVKAYMGSNDFSDTENYGQVDGVTAVRSPGSTLKPFLYALAFDKGLITPKQVVLDVPIISGDYKPENFDGKYRGRITIEDALINSLNIPAVNVLNQYGVLNFIDKLEEANFSSITLNRKNLGLSMILGGCGVTLEELTNLFSIFANNGYYSNLLYHKCDTIYHRKKILSPEASYRSEEHTSELQSH